MNPRLLSTIVLLFTTTLAVFGSHVKSRTVEFKGEVTAISEKKVTVKSASGPRIFRFAENSLVGSKREFIRGTCVMGDSGTTIKFTEVFKIGDQVSVLYFEQNAGRETTAADLWFTDENMATAWRKAHLGHP